MSKEDATDLIPFRPAYELLPKEGEPNRDELLALAHYSLKIEAHEKNTSPWKRFARLQSLRGLKVTAFPEWKT